MIQNIQFLLNPKIHFLNHGSFGATPKPVFQEYQRWRRELEYQPVEFWTTRHSADGGFPPRTWKISGHAI